MAFTDLLNNILSAVYGKDVRQSIHDGLEECHSIAESAYNAATSLSNIATEASTKAEQAYSATNNMVNTVIPNLAGSVSEAKIVANEAKTTADEAKTELEEVKGTANEAKTTADEAKTTADNNKSDIDNLKIFIDLMLEPASIQLLQNVGWRRSGPSRFVQETYSDGLHQGVKLPVSPGEAYKIVTYMDIHQTSEVLPVILATGDSEESSVLKTYERTGISEKAEYLVVIPDGCYYMFISSERSDLGDIEVKKPIAAS